MAKRTEKRKYTQLEAAEVCPLESDLSDLSEGSDPEVFAEGMDRVLDWQESDPEWEPLKPVETEEADEPESPKIPDPSKSTKKTRGRGINSKRGRERKPAAGLSEDTSNGQRLKDPHITRSLRSFRPKRNLGPRLLETADYSALQLFQLFFTGRVLTTLVNNTNLHGRATFKTWKDISLDDLLGFLSLLIYMDLVKLRTFTDYWQQSRLYSLLFPKTVMPRDAFLAVASGLHLSDPHDDLENESKKGTSAYDCFGKIKPLYTEIKTACQENFQPNQRIATDERMVASKDPMSFKQYIKSEPVKWGYKLLVSADSETGYIWDFFIYQGKRTQPTETSTNSKDQHGTMKWIREDTLLVECSANGPETCKQRMKDDDTPIPPAIKDYHMHMDGVDLSDALTRYYQVLHKTKKWYKTLFYHFVDIAVVNSFILYKSQCAHKGIKAMNQQSFRETLTLELADARTQELQPEETASDTHHMPGFVTDDGGRKKGRKKCRQCHLHTAVQCITCNTPLCFVPARNCYLQWHKDKKNVG